MVAAVRAGASPSSEVNGATGVMIRDQGGLYKQTAAARFVLTNAAVILLKLSLAPGALAIHRSRLEAALFQPLQDLCFKKRMVHRIRFFPRFSSSYGSERAK